MSQFFHPKILYSASENKSNKLLSLILINSMSNHIFLSETPTKTKSFLWDIDQKILFSKTGTQFSSTFGKKFLSQKYFLQAVK